MLPKLKSPIIIMVGELVDFARVYTLLALGNLTRVCGEFVQCEVIKCVAVVGSDRYIWMVVDVPSLASWARLYG